MENAEEVMQLLEEFTKMRPKEIPKELEDYLGYVAKTGDPLYQWSLVKNLFREKLIKVITDFFESTLTVELPPCPNVEPFNYDRMKNSLLERFDTFNSAPFTVQRICELLTNPRKEYNRADKYMRAIEKNILVVSTREPGTGKRPLDSDSQQETILNGMPDVKVNESDGSLMHVPTDLPYLGAPPASNDVTVETSEPILADPVNDRVGFGIEINEESKTESNDSIKPWVTQEPLVSVIESEQACSTSELLDVEDTFNKEKGLEIKDCDADSRFVDLENCPSNSNTPISDIVSESSSNVLIIKNEIGLVVSETASIDSSDSSLNINKVQDSFGQSVDANDENEVSSTPTDIVAETLVLEEEIDVPLDSEAEATDSSVEQNLLSVGSQLSDLPVTESEINSSERVIESNDTLSIVTVTEVSGSNDPDETAVECSENDITGTVDSPTSLVSNLSSQSDDVGKFDKFGPLNIEECEQPDIHPDSSNDISEPLKEIQILPVENLMKIDTVTLEADSISDSDEVLNRKNEQSECTLDQNDSNLIKSSSPSVQVSPSLDEKITNVETVVEESSNKVLEENVLPTSSFDQTVGNEAVCIDSVQEDDQNLANSLSVNEVAQVGPMYEQEQREESVIQPLPNVPSDSLKEMNTVEDISVDAGCEVEEEAMDVDDCSNQMMMISEGENEGEPMDQSDQLQS